MLLNISFGVESERMSHKVKKKRKIFFFLLEIEKIGAGGDAKLKIYFARPYLHGKVFVLD